MDKLHVPMLLNVGGVIVAGAALAGEALFVAGRFGHIPSVASVAAEIPSASKTVRLSNEEKPLEIYIKLSLFMAPYRLADFMSNFQLYFHVDAIAALATTTETCGVLKPCIHNCAKCLSGMGCMTDGALSRRQRLDFTASVPAIRIFSEFDY